MVILTAMGGYIRAAEQHSQCLESWFMHVPGLKTVIPSTPYEAKGMMKTAINDPNPVMFIEHKKLLPMKGEVPEEEYTIPFGVADIKKEGRDVTLIAISYVVHLALKAAEELEKEGISVEVVDPRSLYPFDLRYLTPLSNFALTGVLLGDMIPIVFPGINFEGFNAINQIIIFKIAGF